MFTKVKTPNTLFLAILASMVFPGFAQTMEAQEGDELETVKVAFAETGSHARRGETVQIPVELSGDNFFEALVPFSVNPASTAVEGEDFEFVVGDDAPEEENTLLFGDDGEIRRNIEIRILRSSAGETEPKTLILDLQEGGMTVVERGEPSSHTLQIQGDDPVVVSFGEFIQREDEGDTFEIPIELSRNLQSDVRLFFSVIPETASPDLLDLDSDETNSSPVTLSGFGGQRIINVKTAVNGIEEGDKTFRVTLDSAELISAGEDEGEMVVVDDRDFQGIITNIDPREINFLPLDDGFETESRERSRVNLSLNVSNPASEEILVPLSLGGTAVEGTDFTIVSGNPLVIPPGITNVPMVVEFNLRNGEQGPRELIIGLNEPSMESPRLVPGEDREFKITLTDLEDVKLSFGRNVDPGDAFNAPTFEPESERIVGSTDGGLLLAVFLSAPPSEDVTFDVEVLGSSTARLLNTFTQSMDSTDWDYSLSIGARTFRPDFLKREITIPAGTTSAQLVFTFRQKPMPRMDFTGDTPPEPADKTVSLQISNLSTEDPLVEMGEATSYNLTLRDFPNLDITDLFEIQTFGPATFNSATGLFEVPLEMTLTETLDRELLDGYRSMRFEISSKRFDPENPEDPASDPLVENDLTGLPFEFEVRPPHRLAFPSLREKEVLIEGVEFQAGNSFTDENADTVVQFDLILRNLNLPAINPFEEDPTGRHDLNDPIDFTLEFTHGGLNTIDLSRIDPEVSPDNFRVTLSRQEAPESADNNALPIDPRRIRQLPDGNMLFQVPVNAGSGIQIEYWDGEGDWKLATPARIQAEGNVLFWLDNGPPKTDNPSSDIPFRLYRFSQLLN